MSRMIPSTFAELVDTMAVRLDLVENHRLAHEDGYEMTDEELATMNAALGLRKDKNYRPYCLRCSVMPRVVLQRGKGFWCWHCDNRFGFDLRPLSEDSRP